MNWDAAWNFTVGWNFMSGYRGVRGLHVGILRGPWGARELLGRILLETDCPYLAPVPFRGKRNSSLYLPFVVSRIAEIKGITEEEVIRTTERNAEMMYGLT